MTSLKEAQKKYEKGRTIKKVSFNNEGDSELLSFLSALNEEFSPFIKRLIQNEMNRPGFKKDKPDKLECERDPNTVDWVDEVVLEESDRPTGLKEPTPAQKELSHYRSMLMKLFLNPEAYKGISVDLSELTEEKINKMNVEEVREIIGYV